MRQNCKNDDFHVVNFFLPTACGSLLGFATRFEYPPPPPPPYVSIMNPKHLGWVPLGQSRSVTVTMGCKDSQFYSLPSEQAIASRY